MTIFFDVIEDDPKKCVFVTNAEGNDVIRAPLLNKGTAFPEDERKRFRLDGLLPPRVLSLDQQIEKIYQRFCRLGSFYDILTSYQHDSSTLPALKKTIDIARFNFLRDLHDRNEILFYAFCSRHLIDVLPIIYTPTVGDAVMRFSRDSARFRGIFLSPTNIASTSQIFSQFRFQRPTIAVVTDNQGILGLGDQGVGGIDIPVGKLALYVLGAGIRPWETMPLTLDVGTNNDRDLHDPLYLGYKAGRLEGEDYSAFLDQFVQGIHDAFPGILIQWEDFSKQNAFSILDKYRDRVLSFNDDIQGTGSVALAGLLNAMKIKNEELCDQQFIVYGAGAGGVGIARRIAQCLQVKYQLSASQACERIYLLDSKGLVTNARPVEDYKKPFVCKQSCYQQWEVVNENHITLDEVIRNAAATVLVGTSGRAGHFTQDIVQQMLNNTPRPVIFPLSNPTANSEATPEDILQVTQGKAIVATGSPFDPVQVKGTTLEIGQGNNFFIFPGVGLGAILSKGQYIPDAVFTEAAYVLAELTPQKLLDKGTVYPSIADIRSISAQIAYRTIQEIARDQDRDDLSLSAVKAAMWKPGYHTLKKR